MVFSNENEDYWLLKVGNLAQKSKKKFFFVIIVSIF